MAGKIDYTMFKHAAWGGATGQGDIIVLAEDWSGATFLWQFGDAFTSYISLGNAAAGSEGVSASYDAGYDHPDGTADVGATRIRPQIDEATLEGLTIYSGNDDLTLKHVLYVTPIGGARRALAYGTVTIKQEVIDT